MKKNFYVLTLRIIFILISVTKRTVYTEDQTVRSAHIDLDLYLLKRPPFSPLALKVSKINIGTLTQLGTQLSTRVFP